MLLIDRSKFINDITNETCEVKPFPNNYDDFIIDIYYPIGNTLYKYIGKVDNISDIGIGEIGIWSTRYYVNDYEDPYIKMNFDVSRIMDSHIDTDDVYNNIIADYIDGYNKGKNIMLNMPEQMISNGELIVPVMNTNDDPLTRIIKMMIIHKKISRRNYKKSFDKGYSLDNLISAINGSTVNMTISKFITWCEILSIDYEFTLTDNGLLKDYVLDEPLIISNTSELTCEYGETNRGIFKVPLIDGEDPLKRLIKVALIKKNAPLKSYKDNGSTPYLINNMRSALKSNAKMMIPYFINWCNLLGMDYEFKVVDPSDGTEFKSTAMNEIEEYENVDDQL